MTSHRTMRAARCPGRAIVAAFLVALCCLAQAVHAQGGTESRLALVIGNASYKSAPLLNPVNDARLIETALREAGFEVMKAENATLREMRRLVRDFGDRLRASGGVGLFYYAGHGVQVRGENYLVSVDSDIRNEDEVADDAINAQLVLEKMESAGNRVNLIVLDACRNNPFAVKSRAAVSGLATMNAPSGSLVAYSTAPGAVAEDGAGANSLYTKHLARVVRQPGLPVEEVFKQVRAAVRRDSNNRQTPWENTALEGQFYFKPLPQAALAADQKRAGPAAPPAGVDPLTVELAYWDSVKNSTSPAELQSYLKRYPAGVFADLAKARIAALQARPEGAPPAAVATAPEAVPPKAPAAPAAVVATAPATAPPGDVIGSVVIKNLYSRQTESIEVRVVERSNESITYSSGDVIASDGQVLAVRLGTMVGRLKSGTLWKVPLQVGASGRAQVQMRDQQTNAQLDWRVVDRKASRATLEVRLTYHIDSSGRNRSGTWSATYEDGVPVATSFKLETRSYSTPPLGGGPDLIAGTLQRP
jgi:Caspase domain